VDKRTVILLDVTRSARVPASNEMRFVRLVRFAIVGAHRESALPVGKRISAGALTRDFFDPIARAAKRLRMELERLQGKSLAAGEAARSMAAAHHFGDGLRALSQPGDASDPIGHFLNSMNLGLVIAVAEHARTHAKRWLSKRLARWILSVLEGAAAQADAEVEAAAKEQPTTMKALPPPTGTDTPKSGR
jgi:hypothetical protein